MKPIGKGLGLVTVNPYGCNAPAVPLASWNVDLDQQYMLFGVAMSALTIPTKGDSLAQMCPTMQA